ncbi:MAG: alpha/beta hydrolase [Pseudomonadota bacterium]
MQSPQPVDISLNDLTIRGIRSSHGNTNLPRVLCLHGWLDNANSFQPLLPLLPQLDCIAIDLPGHGLSGHFQQAVPYTIANSAHYVLQVAEALGWDNFHLLGHSLGGCIAPVCALAAPEQIISVTTIDALGPISEPDSAIAERLRRFHQEMLMRNRTASRLFTNKQQAIDSRLKAAKMDTPSAALIVERQLQKVSGGWQWRFDPKLRAASPSYFTESQVQSILRAVSCPTLCVAARDGHLAKFTHFHKRTKCLEKLQVVELDGRHHLHMDNPLPVAHAITGFFDSLPAD